MCRTRSRDATFSLRGKGAAKPTRQLRSGCLTCMARKVKRAISFTVCKRCVSNGRTCKGLVSADGGFVAPSTSLPRPGNRISKMAQANAGTRVGRKWRNDRYTEQEAEDCIAVDNSIFRVTEAGEPGLMESSEAVASEEDVPNMEALEDEDIIMANHASVATFENAAQIIPSALTDAFDMAHTDGFSQRSREQPMTDESQFMSQSQGTYSGPYNTELQSLTWSEQMHPQIQDASLLLTVNGTASSLANVSTRGNHRLPQPLQTAPSSGPVIPQQLHKPPAVTFTIENEIKTSLSPTEIERLFRVFSANTRLLLRSWQSPDKVVLYAVEALMTQTSTDFYKWYTVESQAAAKVSVLAFNLLDCQWCDRAMLVPGGNLRDFQLLKQAIWDSFWLTSSLKSAPALFCVHISHIPDNVLVYGSVRPTPEMTASSRKVGSAMSNASRLASSMQQPRPAYTGRKSNIYHLLNDINVDT